MPRGQFWGAWQRSVQVCKYSDLSSHLGTRGEVKCLTNGELGEVDIKLGLVNTVTPEVFVHYFHRNALVVQVRLYPQMKPSNITRDRLQ